MLLEFTASAGCEARRVGFLSSSRMQSEVVQASYLAFPSFSSGEVHSTAPAW